MWHRSEGLDGGQEFPFGVWGLGVLGGALPDLYLNAPLGCHNAGRFLTPWSLVQRKQWTHMAFFPNSSPRGTSRPALEREAPQRQPQKRLDRRLEEATKSVGGNYWRLQMPLKLALAARETLLRVGWAHWRKGGGGCLPPFRCIHASGPALAVPRQHTRSSPSPARPCPRGTRSAGPGPRWGTSSRPEGSILPPSRLSSHGRRPKSLAHPWAQRGNVTPSP